MSKEISPTDYCFRLKDGLLGAQMLFVAFGALVLGPLLTGLNPNVALFTAGVGTLVFQVITKGRVPVFLASSFAFIAPIIYGVQTWGIPSTLCGLAAAGVLYALLSLIVKVRGSHVIARIFPPIVTGPVIMVIGLILAPVAVHMAMGRSGDGSLVLVPENQAMIVSMIALITTLFVTLLGKGMMRLVPILCGIIAGYVTAICFGLVNFQVVMDAPWLQMPPFVFPEWNLSAVLFMIPVALAPAIELFGAIMVVGLNTLVRAGQDLLEARNLIIVALVIVFGIGLSGMLGVVLNLALPKGRPVKDEQGRPSDPFSVPE